MNTDKPSPALHYFALLADIKQRIGQAQTRAMLAVNAELIRLYWEIGQMLDARQKIEGWGAAVIPRLARDIRNELPEVKGFSERNIKRMLAFYREYRDLEFVPQAVAQIEPAEKVPQPVALFPQELLSALPWGHHLLLMEKINFYCSVVDDVLRHESDAATIGLILCQQQNEVVAEYALRGVDKPIGVSTFELTRALPSELESSLPTIEQIERELCSEETAK